MLSDTAIRPASPLLAAERPVEAAPPPQWQRLGIAAAALLPVAVSVLFVAGAFPAGELLEPAQGWLHDRLWLPAVGWSWTAPAPFGWLWLLGGSVLGLGLLLAWARIPLSGGPLLDRLTEAALLDRRLSPLLLRWTRRTGDGAFAPLHLGAVAAARHDRLAAAAWRGDRASLAPAAEAAALEAQLLAAIPGWLQQDPALPLRAIATAILLRARGGDTGPLWTALQPLLDAADRHLGEGASPLWQGALRQALVRALQPGGERDGMDMALAGQLLAELTLQLTHAGDVRTAPPVAAELQMAPRLAALLALERGRSGPGPALPGQALPGQALPGLALLDAFRLARLQASAPALDAALPAMQQLAAVLLDSGAVEKASRAYDSLARMAGREATHA